MPASVWYEPNTVIPKLGLISYERDPPKPNDRPIPRKYPYFEAETSRDSENRPKSWMKLTEPDSTPIMPGICAIPPAATIAPDGQEWITASPGVMLTPPSGIKSNAVSDGRSPNSVPDIGAGVYAAL